MSIYPFVPAGSCDPAFFVSRSLRGRWFRVDLWGDWEWVG